MILLIFLSGSGTGTAENKASVYGCSGFLNIISFDPVSTISPRYITPTLSEIYSTTDKSCEMNRYVKLYLDCKSFNKLMICAWMETSSADTGSSQTMNLGLSANALAIQIL